MSSVWHFHERCGHKFLLDHVIRGDEPCPRCGRTFNKRVHHTCNGCNTVYYSDKLHQKGAKFICPISGEPVVVTNVWWLRQYIHNLRWLWSLIGLVITILIGASILIWLINWLAIGIDNLFNFLSELFDFSIILLIAAFWVLVGFIIFVLQFLLLSLAAGGVLFILYTILHDIVAQPVAIQRYIYNAALTNHPLANVAMAISHMDRSNEDKISKKIVEAVFLETQNTILRKGNQYITPLLARTISNDVTRIAQNTILSDFSRDAVISLSRNAAITIRQSLPDDVPDKAVNKLAREVADAVYWRTANLVLQETSINNFRTTRRQQIVVCMLIIGIGVGTLLCYLSERTAQETTSFLRQLLSFNTINIVVFAMLWYGVKLFGSRYGLNKILQSGDSLLRFIILTPILGTSNVIALLFVDYFMSELSGFNISKIGMILVSDVVLGVFLTLFLEKSPAEWIKICKVWFDRVKRLLALATK